MKVNLAVVDDELDVEILYKMSLRKEIKQGIVDVFFFSSGRELLEFLRQKNAEIKILILVSDINMPNMDGVTLVKAVHEEFPLIDLYLSSAYDYNNYAGDASTYGLKGYFEKPVDFEEVRKLVLQKAGANQ